MNDEVRNQRQYFRLKLPKGEELSVWINGEEYRANEIAEQSIQLTESCISDKDRVCEGEIRWSNGTTTAFSGMVDEVLALKQVIVGVHGIDLANIVAEQRRLLSMYPMLKLDED